MERGFQALLEEIAGKVDAFGEQVKSLTERMEHMGFNIDQRFEITDKKIDLHTRTIIARIDAHERNHAKHA